MKQLFSRTALFIYLFSLGISALSHASSEKKMVVVITSYNNKEWYKKNLDSVFNQNYSNYRIIYIDDRSPDGTGKLVQSYIQQKGQAHRTTLVLQPTWKSQMFNHYQAVYMCDDDEIVCHLDGDDWLYDENTLSIINDYYTNNDIWLTVGLPYHTDGSRRPVIPTNMYEIIDANSYRKDGWYFNHLRTFYAWLFKLIKLQDLMFEGNFANMAPAPDVAMMYPMYEMAGHHGHVIHDLLYTVNLKNPISQWQLKPVEEIFHLADTIRLEWPEYKPLYQPVKNRLKAYENKKAYLIIFIDSLASANPAHIKKTIEQLSNISGASIIFEDKGRKSLKHIQRLSVEFPQEMLIAYDPKTTFLSALLDHSIQMTSDDYLIFASADQNLDQKIDASACIKELERTFAYGFYLHLKYCDELKNLCAPLTDSLIAWQPQYTHHIFPLPNALGIALYRKKDILNALQKMRYLSITEFMEQWAHHPMPDRCVNLCYKH